MVELKNISKHYGETEILSNLSLTIKKGQITTLIGANGAGKSTALSIMAGLLEPSGGQVFIDGLPVSTIADFEMAKKMAVLRQTNHLNIRLTLRELVSFGRFPHSKGRLTEVDEIAIAKAIDYLNLRKIQDKYIDEVSGGQLQRAYIAMVVAQDTEYILMDEPLNNLDMKHSVDMMKTLRKLVDELGKTIILVIHDINFASCYSDEIIALKEGHLVSMGLTADLMDAKVLKDIFDLDFEVTASKGNKICIYYT